MVAVRVLSKTLSRANHPASLLGDQTAHTLAADEVEALDARPDDALARDAGDISGVLDSAAVDALLHAGQGNLAPAAWVYQRGSSSAR
jgi:hypothetical protein